MPIGRDRGHRLAVTASLLLGLLGVLLGCVAGTAVAGPSVPSANASDTVVTVAVAGQTAGTAPAQAPGCGRGSGDEDSGAHPGIPPRGSSAHELLPALHQDAGAPASAPLPDGATPPVRPLRGPPPLAPPSPLDLSILRV